MYDLTNSWTLGGKYAYRQGEVSQDRVDPTFFANRAHLYVLRADWHFLHSWDALVEGRRLDLPDAKESRDGALMALRFAPAEEIDKCLPLIMPWTTHSDWWLRESAFTALSGLEKDDELYLKIAPTLLTMMTARLSKLVFAVINITY